MSHATNPRTLGILWLIYGCTRIAAAAWLVVYNATLVLMWGALLNRVPDALAWMAAFHAVLVLLLAWCVFLAFFAFAEGFGVLRRSGSARSLGLVAGVLALPDWPLGLALGVYTLVKLYSGAAPGRLQGADPVPQSAAQPWRMRESH
jgi:hypothetical protein